MSQGEDVEVLTSYMTKSLENEAIKYARLVFNDSKVTPKWRPKELHKRLSDRYPNGRWHCIVTEERGPTSWVCFDPGCYVKFRLRNNNRDNYVVLYKCGDLAASE